MFLANITFSNQAARIFNLIEIHSLNDIKLLRFRQKPMILPSKKSLKNVDSKLLSFKRVFYLC